MPVHFVYRSHYEGPMGLFRRSFDQDDTVVDWFRRHWGENEDSIDRVVGTHVYGFGSLFRHIPEEGLDPPRNYGQLREYLDEYLYVEGEIRHSPHCLQVLTDDDEIQLAYYVFDGHYLAKHADRAALLLQDWPLPSDAGPGGFTPAVRSDTLRPRGGGEGTTYLVFHGYHDSLNLDDLDGVDRVEGVRLPELARWLARAEPAEGDWPVQLFLIRALLFPEPREPKGPDAGFLSTLLDDPGDETSWGAYGDWLEEQGRPGPGVVMLEQALRRATRYPLVDPPRFGAGTVRQARAELRKLTEERRPIRDAKKSLVSVDEHIAQACLHSGRWGKRDLYHQWFLFDDLWASAHPALANALLRYTRRWDVLTPSDR